MASQPDRDEPRRFIITGNRHGRQGRLDSPLVEVVEGPPIQMGERVEVVESREPFPSDEDVEKAAYPIFVGVAKAPWTRRADDQLCPVEPFSKNHARNIARAVLDAVSSHRDDEARER